MQENDFDIDKLFDDQDAFKPLTKGLGFHHSLKSEEEINNNLKKSSELLRNDLERRAKSLNTSVSIEKTSLDRGDLSPFYAKEQTISENKTPRAEVKLFDETEVKVITRFSAWLIDFTLVLGMYALTLLAIAFASAFSLNILTDLNMAKEIVKETLPLFVFFYLFYFSFLDKTNYSTLGKRFLSLNVRDMGGRPITMYQAFLRSFLTLVGVLSLGLFCILDFQGKMTETRVVKA